MSEDETFRNGKDFRMAITKEEKPTLDYATN